MPDASAPVATRVVIEGRVQGVWYRGWTVDEATRLGLNGWVRNLRDGSVEALFAGPEAGVREMIARCRQGPGLARVDRVHEHPAQPPEAAGFRQLPTG